MVILVASLIMAILYSVIMTLNYLFLRSDLANQKHYIADTDERNRRLVNEGCRIEAEAKRLRHLILECPRCRERQRQYLMTRYEEGRLD